MASHSKRTFVSTKNEICHGFETVCNTSIFWTWITTQLNRAMHFAWIVDNIYINFYLIVKFPLLTWPKNALLILMILVCVSMLKQRRNDFHFQIYVFHESNNSIKYNKHIGLECIAIARRINENIQKEKRQRERREREREHITILSKHFSSQYLFYFHTEHEYKNSSF